METITKEEIEKIGSQIIEQIQKAKEKIKGKGKNKRGKTSRFSLKLTPQGKE